MQLKRDRDYNCGVKRFAGGLNKNEKKFIYAGYLFTFCVLTPNINKKSNMKNSFKLAVLTLAIAVSAVACKGKSGENAGDTTKTVIDSTVTKTTVDTTKTDTVVKKDTVKVDSTKKM